MPAWRVVFVADRDPVDLVLEMRGQVIRVEPFEKVEFHCSGPEDAELMIGVGSNHSASVFRDARLDVTIRDDNGASIPFDGFA